LIETEGRRDVYGNGAAAATNGIGLHRRETTSLQDRNGTNISVLPLRDWPVALRKSDWLLPRPVITSLPF